MLNALRPSALRPVFGRLFTPVARALARTPITPNMVTVAGTVAMTAAALSLFPTGHLLAGVIVCTICVFTDVLDGTLARMKGTTGPWGAFLDSTLDRVADASVFGGLAAYFVYGGHSRLLAGVALFCLVAGALVSYAKARAESLGVRCDVGIAERTERLVIALVAAGLAGLGVPYVLAIGLWLLAALTLITLGQRVLAVRSATVGAGQAQAAGGAGQAQAAGGAGQAQAAENAGRGQAAESAEG